MTRDAEGRWRHDCFDALTMMEDVVDICDPEEQQKLLAAALDAYRQDQRAAVCR
ncbi:MAG: hypothetical protein GVY28_01755 [Alphaproteobacteria bacterium]|nr:hypothetical protein [Alphaproteobacteria bacterium]